MAGVELPAAESHLLADGCVLPAHPLALDADRRLDERRQRALTRYYVDAGAGGVAVGVHTTQFAIRQAGLLRPVFELTRDTLDSYTDRPFLRIAGVCGDIRQAVLEAELAAECGFHAAMLGPAPDLEEPDLLLRAKAIGEVLPVIGFYLQEAVGGRYLSASYWRELADLPCVVAAKLAPFDRYRTLEAVQGIASADRGDEVALYTGNDDTIVADLLTPYEVRRGDRVVRRRIVGGLLGQWAVWTRNAVELLDVAHRSWAGDDSALRTAIRDGARLTEANAAIFDTAHRFAGCIAGVHEVLRRQGMLEGTWCLDPDEQLSPGQAELIDEVCRKYPDLADDAFVEEHRDRWLA